MANEMQPLGVAIIFGVGLLIGYSAAPDNTFADRVNSCREAGKVSVEACFEYAKKVELESYYYHTN